MKEILTKLYDDDRYDISFVGGSDLDKQKEQLGEYIDLFLYKFTQNGVIAYKDWEKISDEVFFF